MIMRLTRLTTICLALCVGTLWVACDERETSPPPITASPAARANTSLDSALINEPMVWRVLEIRDSMTAHIVDAGANMDSLAVYYSTGDSSGILTEIAYTPTELEAIDNEIDSLATELRDKYPELDSLVSAAATPCSFGSCPERDNFFTNSFDEFTSYTSDQTKNLMQGQFQNGGDPPPQQDGCEWGQYFAALLVCSGTGPILYWPCAYVAMCAYCWGPTVDDICI